MARRRSNTLGNKIKDQESLAEKQTNTLVDQETILRKITLKKNKCTLNIQIQGHILGNKLFETLEKQAYVAEEKQIVFFKREKIIPCRQTWMKSFYFSDNDFIHLHNKDLIDREVINVTLAFLNNQYIKYVERPLTARPDQNIRHALEQVLTLQLEDVDQSMYVQSGRFLNIGSSFRNECIQDGSIILVMPLKQNSSVLTKLQQRQIEVIASRCKYTKRTTLISMDNVTQTGNFKKKCKCNVYKSILIAESKEMVWQEDTSSQFSKKILAKSITKKKPKKPSSNQIPNFKQNFSKLTNYGSCQMDIEGLQKSINPLPIQVKTKAQLLRDGKRLILSACLLRNRQKKQKPLKQPPKMTIQAQQINSSSESESDQDDELMQLKDFEQNNLKFSAPLDSLKKSIGKREFLSYTPPLLAHGDDQDEQFEDF